MKSLFEGIIQISLEDDFSVHFSYMNLMKGWEIAQKWKCDDMVRKKLIKLVAYRYSYESPLLKRKKDAFELKCAICEYLELDIDDFVMDCIRNKEYDFECYVTWWLKENGDRDFSILASLDDELSEQLQMVREGVKSYFNIATIQDIPAAMAIFKKMEISMKGTAAKRASELRKETESLAQKLEKNYQYLHNSIKSESTSLADNMPWAEWQVLKRRQQ
jgi:hypothetical protein